MARVYAFAVGAGVRDVAPSGARAGSVWTVGAVGAGFGDEIDGTGG